MRFHWPSFLLGYGAGALSALLAKQLRPVVTELATAVYEVSDAIAARAAMWWEDVDDVVAEAKARARRPRLVKGARARR